MTAGARLRLARLAATLAALSCAISASSCDDTGRRAVRFPFHAGGTGVSSLVSESGWTVHLGEAQVAFGPAYFCASSAADLELCTTAVAELRDSVTLDALAPPDALGEVDAVTGTVRSAMWDHGLTFLLPDGSPRATAGAVEGRSARFAGSAERGAERFDWVARIEIVASVAGAPAIRAVRTLHEITSDDDALVVRFDPAAILSHVDWDAVAASAEGGVARIEPGSIAHNAIVIAMSSSELPTLEWAAP